MAFVWTNHIIRIARALSEAGFSAAETAIVIGATRPSLLGRSYRKSEFQFKAMPRAIKFSDEVASERMEAAYALAATIPPDETPLEIVKRVPKRKSNQVAAIRARANQPVVCRSQAEVESPLTEKEKAILFGIDGPNESSITFLNMKDHHCKWIVSEIDGLDTMMCGRKRIEESSYCQHHHDRSVSKRQLKKLSYKAALKLDQNIKHVVPGMEKSSSHLRKS
jgi:hypothetical protein